MRINREPALYEMARAVSYGGVRSGQLRDRMEEMSKKYGSGPIAMAFTEITMTDPATMLTVLKPHVRRLCKQFLGPPPEDPGYAEYWRERGREPPEHRPPAPDRNGTAPPKEETPPPEPPKWPWRYEPSDEALEAFEKLEGWMRGGDERPVDADAEDTLRVLARALLQGHRGWMQAADARLKALQKEPPGYVSNKDLMAFDEVIDDLLDRLHEIMFADKGWVR